MQELTLTIDYCDFLGKELEDYLITLNGINEIKINNSNNQIYIKYNYDLIKTKILVLEIKLFLNKLKLPSIIGFNKHPKNNLKEYSIIIKDLCCEYCLNTMIEELLFTEGIEKCYSDFNYKNKKNVKIKINYRSDIITIEEIQNLEKKFNQ